MSKYRLPWIRQQKRSQPEIPERPPLLLGPISNGEIFRPETDLSRRVQKLIMDKAEYGARRLGIDRREFLASSMGMATTLWALNMAGCSSDGDGGEAPGPGSMMGSPDGGIDGGPLGMGSADASEMMSRIDGSMGGPADAGGYFDVPKDPTDPEKVCQVMRDASKEFIFDIQTHHVHRSNVVYDVFFRDLSQYKAVCGPALTGPVDCFDRSEYIRLMFLESDTSVAVLSGLPAVDDANNPITNPEIAEARDIINMMADGTQRLINHHMVLPNQGGRNADSVKRQLAAMEKTLQMYGKVGAWKCYPAWAPENTPITPLGGYFLDDEVVGIPFITKGLELGVGTFCIHKGLPIPGFSSQFNDPVDIGRVAKRFPQAKFIVYHSGFGQNNGTFYTEGAYTNGSRVGTSSLITSMIENGIGPNSNVFAELGTTWQVVSTSLRGDMLNTAAHVVGKLLKYVGEDNVVWGTDSIWYGSPQSQIESFLQFQISEQYQQQYGYPALTMERKRKILGLNAARAYGIDPTAMRCGIDKSEIASAKRTMDAELGGRRWAFFKPEITSRREFFSFHKANGYRPG